MPINIPEFSVIISTYNRAKLLERALHSLLAQTENNWEAIIIDDGSTDNSEEIVHQIFTGNQNFQYHKQANQGEAGAKNKGISLAKGRFITFLDSDDTYLPEHLESRKKILKENPEIEFLHGGVKIIGNQYVPDLYHDGKNIHLSQCAIGGTFFVRRDIIVRLKGFRNLPIGADADLLNRAESLGVKILKTEIPTYVYHRENDDSITKNYGKLHGCD